MLLTKRKLKIETERLTLRPPNHSDFRAWTTLRDSVGAPPKTIYLKLYAQDKETRAEKQQGRWEDFRFKLESANPQIGESQEQVLAYMGLSNGWIK